MGKVKEQLLNGLNQEELERELYHRYESEYDYEQWLQSDDFVEYVNAELDNLKPIYSVYDISSAMRYASTHITIDPSEVGKEVYDMLFSEKIEEYLSLHR